MAYLAPAVTASGATFAQLQAAGSSGLLELLIAANKAAQSAPTVAATLSANAGGGAGGLLPAGVYYANFTESDGSGETPPSAESGPITVAVQAAPAGTPTVSVTGSGGTLPVGVYFGKFTYVDSNLNASGVHGETTAGTEFTFTQTTAAEPVVTINDGGLPAWASGRNLYLTVAGGGSGNEVLAFTGITATTYTIATNPAASTTTPPTTNGTTTNIPKITAFPALQAGNIARNVYLTPAGGGSGSELLYARETTASTFTFSAAAPATNYAVPPPSSTTNTTGLLLGDLQAIRACKAGNLQGVYNNLRTLVDNFDRGSPIVHAQMIFALKRFHLLFAVLAEMMLEMGTLVEANPGHIGYMQTGIGNAGQKRTWP